MEEYLVIGLKDSGEMVLCTSHPQEPSIKTIEELAHEFGYTQVLVVRGMVQVRRYIYRAVVDSVPLV